LVSTLNERATTSAPLVPVDPERRALETQIEQAKHRLVRDLNRASKLLRHAAGTAGRGLLRVALLGAVVVVGLVAALLRRRHRIRVTWK